MRRFHHQSLGLLIISPILTVLSLESGCETGIVARQTWSDMNIDSYLSNGTNWGNLTLAEYAKTVRANNFRCGIGQQCLVGQVCSPVESPAWHVLYAIQEFNLRMNLLYKVSAFAIDIVKETTSAIISDLTKPDTSPRVVMAAASLIGLIASLTGLSSLLIAAVSVEIIEVQLLSTLNLILASAVVVLPDVAPAVSARPERKEFVSLATIGHHISKWGLEYHQHLDTWIKNVLKAPMSSPGGLIDIIKGGTFFLRNQTTSVQQILDGYREVLEARVIVAVLRAKNAFITRGNDLCTGKGPNGADVGSSRLSWCDKSGVMMRIVLAHGDKVEKDIYAGEIIAAKYGLSTELITSSSWECQQKYGMGYDPYKTEPLPNDIHAECVINLPVCDCTRTDIQKARQDHGLAVACRGVGFLPI
ncbi:hypothetical protein DFH28DRAFT_956113 [Melampsora americana]|nr:hypothetical protein DFH28DRAFT_956113 [Melampsora americana]